MQSSTLGRSYRRFLFDGTLSAFVVLFAGFRIFSPPEDWFLKTGQLTLVLLATIVACGILFNRLNSFGIRTVGRILFKEASDHTGHVLPWYSTFWGWQLFLILLTLLWTGLSTTKFSFFELFSEDGFDGAQRIFSALFDPNFAIFSKGLVAIFETIFIAFTATFFSVPIAFILAFFAARNLMRRTPLARVVCMSIRTTFNLTRSIEPLIWAIVFSVWVGIGPFAGMMALMLHSIASLTKHYSELIECVNDGPIEGIESTGASPLQVTWFAVVPQVILPYVSYTVDRWDINVRMATVIGLVGGGGIGTMLMQYQGLAMWREVGCLVLLIAAVVWIMDAASAHIRAALK